MPDYIEYHKSVAQEFKALENRVRYIIDNANWGEEGRYKEILIMNYLKRILPKNVSVGTGFVLNEPDRDKEKSISKQIDVIVYDHSFPCYFKEGDFVVVPASSVLAIVEVKTRINSGKLAEIIGKANQNGRIIMKTENSDPNRQLFNGIFCFNKDSRKGGKNSEIYREEIEQMAPYAVGEANSVVNHICFGEKSFMRSDNLKNSGILSYSFYNFSKGEAKDLAFSYFFSNLLQCVCKNTSSVTGLFPERMDDFLFPIPNGKNFYKIEPSIDMLKRGETGR